MRRTFWKMTLLGLLLAGLPGASLLADDATPAVKTTVQRVAVFKNGLGFVIRQGEMPAGAEWLMLDRLPEATLGSLWFGTDRAAVAEVITFRESVTDTVPVADVRQLMKANMGRNVSLTHGLAGIPNPLAGQLLPLAEGDQPNPPPQPDPRISAARPLPTPEAGIELVRLKVQTGPLLGQTILFPLNAIQSVSFTDEPALVTRRIRQEPRARLRLDGVASGGTLTMAYLEKGLHWTPAYRLDITTPEEAGLVMEAVLVNDVEELENCVVSFVVGFPSFAYADVSSPLSLDQSVADFLRALQSGGNRFRRNLDQSMMTQSLANIADYDLDPATNYSAAAPSPGESQEDLFFYHQENVTLKAGERARYSLLSAAVPYEHVYLLELPDQMNVDERGYRRNSGQPDGDTVQVWHALRVKNTSGLPWTTAPVLVVKKELPVAQGLLPYTAPGARNTVRLTVATDVRAEVAQTEEARTVVMISGDDYEKVEVAGQVVVHNGKDEAIRLNLVKSMTGTVMDSQPAGEMRKVAKKILAVNPQSEIEWEFDLPAGEKREITYRYSLLINR
ncbi:MAG: hypothetical protein JXQ27_05975 [Acidobacteria bacterium]|nr:hypothetical protein [Acidobacteriota bacterium]